MASHELLFGGLYQPLQPEMDVSLKLGVIQKPPGEDEQDTDALFQWLQRGGLRL